MTRRCWIAAAVMLCGIAGRAPAEEFTPYVIPAEQFAARVHRIALQPLALPAGTERAAAVRAELEGLITAALRAKGYVVVESTAYDAIWRQMATRLGGTFDPVTGARRDEAFAAARDHTGRELARLHEVDAILDPFVTIGAAPYGATGGLEFGPFFSYETWDEPLLWEGRTIAGSVANRPQQVRGSYLNVIITDLAGDTLYGIRSGIEWTDVYAARGHEEKPPAQRFATPERNRRAVSIALDPLVAASPR